MRIFADGRSLPASLTPLAPTQAAPVRIGLAALHLMHRGFDSGAAWAPGKCAVERPAASASVRCADFTPPIRGARPFFRASRFRGVRRTSAIERLQSNRSAVADCALTPRIGAASHFKEAFDPATGRAAHAMTQTVRFASLFAAKTPAIPDWLAELRLKLVGTRHYCRRTGVLAQLLRCSGDTGHPSLQSRA